MVGQSHRRLWILLSTVAALFIGVVVWLVVETTGTKEQRPRAVEDTTTKVVTASDGGSTVSVPSKWAQMPESLQVSGAVIAQAQIYQERYLMVVSDEKADFKDFADYEETALISVEGLGGTATGQPEPIEVGGRPAVRYELTGEFEGNGIVYWCTVVDGPRAYHQILTWTLADRRDQAEPALRTVTDSFREK
ncbi:hypothetical protein [Alloactinosynnema sp. L-07]|uniref:hypothetical protein n=1 Tax=Alloactinosynnema sp. L-07 TaxID=1653480 RepID=UPI0006B5C7EC|nr:hypothetical protein [Alloactinosynnema sp. L-07]